MCDKKSCFYSLSLKQLEELLLLNGLKKFRSSQLFSWIYQKGVFDSEDWLNISKKDKEIINQYLDFSLPEVENREEDKNKTIKLLLKLFDNNYTETVLMKEKNHYTFCISSQCGCPLACKFCATGKLGLRRNLESGEILAQILILKSLIPKYKGKLNLVFMGMGEPFLNYDNLSKALQIICSDKALSISPKNITISTVGILDKIKELSRDYPKIKLSFSLNGSSSEGREKLMPVNRVYPLEDILNYFVKNAGKNMVTFEYVMIKDINDTQKDAKKLVALIKKRKMKVKVNLIPYNKVDGNDFVSPSEESVDRFSQYLADNFINVTVRRSKGKDIASACGQLAGKRK